MTRTPALWLATIALFSLAPGAPCTLELFHAKNIAFDAEEDALNEHVDDVSALPYRGRNRLRAAKSANATECRFTTRKNVARFEWEFDHARAADSSHCSSDGILVFVAEGDIAFKISGQYALRHDTGQVKFAAHLWDMSSSNNVFSSLQQSDTTPRQAFRLSEVKGDKHNQLKSLPSGTLKDGHSYCFHYAAQTLGRKNGGCDTARGELTLVLGNEPPVAVAGADTQIVLEGECRTTLGLDGSGSNDPDGDSLTYRWAYGITRITGCKARLSLPVGTHTLRLKVTDSRGGEDEDTLIASVTDSEPPKPLRDSLPDIRGECSVEISEIPRAVHRCTDTVRAMTEDPLTYTEPGTYKITWVYDAGGNAATQTQQIVLRDMTPPELTNIPLDMEVDADSPGGARIELPVPTATDNCDPKPKVTSDAPKLFPPGETTVTYTAVDKTGNEAIATVKVSVGGGASKKGWRERRNARRKAALRSSSTDSD